MTLTRRQDLLLYLPKSIQAYSIFIHTYELKRLRSPTFADASQLRILLHTHESVCEGLMLKKATLDYL